MTIERTPSEVIIRVSSDIKTEDLQALVDLARYKELTSKFSIDQATVDELARDINKEWWIKNKSQFE